MKSLHQHSVLEEREDLDVRMNLALHLKLNLRLHQGKLLAQLLRLQVPSNPRELHLALSIFPALTNYRGESSRRLRGQQKVSFRRVLRDRGKSPLCWSVRREAARVAYPVTHHGTETDPASRNSSDQSPMCWI